ncbi:MAG: M23 family peptidase, partial [Pseudolabrys sp.]
MRTEAARSVDVALVIFVLPGCRPAARQASPRAQSAAAISRHLQRTHNGYTLTHAGHQIRIGPVAFWIVVGGLVAMAIWSIATGTYFAFRDNVLTRLIGRQAEMQFAYEDRIAELRAQVDRIMSRQLLDQEQFEKTLNSLLQRQSTLEQRASVLAGDPSTTGTVKPARTPAAMPPAEKPVRVSPISDTVIFVAPADREARLQSRELPTGGIAERAAAGGVNGMLARISLSLDKVEQKQAATLTDLEERIDTRARRIHSVLSDLGVNLGRASADRATGGPFVPVKPPQSGASA